jgi:hypothetical protein
VSDYLGRHAFVPSLRWREQGVHWHAYLETARKHHLRERSDRWSRLAAVPAAVLYTPDEVAQWIENRTTELGDRRRVFIPGQGWAEINDPQDLRQMFEDTVRIVARGDSFYSDIYSDTLTAHVYAEAVISDECPGH